MSLPLILHAAAGTHRGRVRELNEDAVLALIHAPEQGVPVALLAVADGMGGHQAGEVASRLALETLQERLGELLQPEENSSRPPILTNTSINDTAPGTLSYLEEWVRSTINRANSVIFDYAQQNPEEAGNLGCTVTCVLIFNDVAVIANVGDSRTYLLHESQLLQITDDHSYVGELVRTGQIEAEDIFEHPQRNVVTRAMGSQPEVEVDLWSYPLSAGDRLLLCSDGLWEMVHDPAVIAQVLIDAESVETAVQNLIDMANAHGGADNIGVVVGELTARRAPTEHE